MASSFDPTIKTLVELSPGDWLKLVGRKRKRTTVEDTDLGTVVSGAGDKVFRVHDDPAYLLHLDFETGHFHQELLRRLRMYNSVYSYRHRRYVLSVVVLLRPEAHSPQWSGRFEERLKDYAKVNDFPYEVIPVWDLDPQQLLSGGIGTLALAPISKVQPSEVRGIIQQMKAKLSASSTQRVQDVWAATYVLMGLRYSQDFTQTLFQEVLGMKESVTYQAIIQEGKTQGLAEGRAKGRAEEARQFVLTLGENKFQKPAGKAVRESLEAISEVSELEALGVRILHVNSWEDLLAGKKPTPRRRRSS